MFTTIANALALSATILSAKNKEITFPLFFFVQARRLLYATEMIVNPIDSDVIKSISLTEFLYTMTVINNFVVELYQSVEQLC